MVSNGQDSLRQQVTRLLAGGIATAREPVPQTSEEAREIIEALMGNTTLEHKLVTAGFALHPRDGQRCKECMYYRVTARWCVLPELNLPAEEDWWCRLWRI